VPRDPSEELAARRSDRRGTERKTVDVLLHEAPQTIRYRAAR
jgi:hypothetical protein